MDLGITHMDIKYENILHAPSVSLASSCDLSSDHGSVHSSGLRVFQCRIIDFEMSRKSNFSQWRLKHADHSYLRRLISNLPKGRVIGQNNE